MKTSEIIGKVSKSSQIIPSKRLRIGDYVAFDYDSLHFAQRFHNVAEGRVVRVIDGNGHAHCRAGKIQEVDLVVIEGNENCDDGGATSDSNLHRGHLDGVSLERISRKNPEMFARMGYEKLSDGTIVNPEKEAGQFYETAFDYIDFVGVGGLNTEIINEGLDEYKRLRELNTDYDVSKIGGYKKMKETLDIVSWSV